MINYLYQTSDLNLFLVLCTFFIGLSILALLFIRAYMPLHLRYQENAVIGCTSALIVVIYGVLAGFATLYLINTNNAAVEAIQTEASTIALLYRNSAGLEATVANQIQHDLKNYLAQVLEVEWGQMNQGARVASHGHEMIKDIADKLTHYQMTNNTQQLVLANMLSLSDKLYEARAQRIQLSYASLCNEIWVVIIVGTILTLCVCYLFGVNFYLHIFVAIATALMTSAILFLLISLDKPFQGAYVVGPEPYALIKEYLNK
jgi:hypothetical protein